MSEEMTPQEIFKFINSDLRRMELLIVEHQGFIDKYIGDAIMSLFRKTGRLKSRLHRHSRAWCGLKNEVSTVRPVYEPLLAISMRFLPKHRGFKPPPLGALFLSRGLNPLPKNFALICQLSTVNCYGCSIGISMINSAPWPGAETQLSFPPCSSITL